MEKGRIQEIQGSESIFGHIWENSRPLRVRTLTWQLCCAESLSRVRLCDPMDHSP